MVCVGGSFGLRIIVQHLADHDRPSSASLAFHLNQGAFERQCVLEHTAIRDNSQDQETRGELIDVIGFALLQEIFEEHVGDHKARLLIPCLEESH